MAKAWRVYEMEIDVRYSDEIPVVEGRGECDLVTSRKLQKTAYDLMDAGHQCLIFDLRGTKYIDSSGFRVLVEAQKRARAMGGGIVIYGLPGPVRHVFDVMRLGDVIPIADDLQKAAAMLTSCKSPAKDPQR